MVEEIGAELKTVSLLAADTSVTRQLRAAYSPLVTPALLDRWLADPTRAPGREVSSPWPERIDVDSVTTAGAQECRVDGQIVYLTSQEAAHGVSAETRSVALTQRRRNPLALRSQTFSDSLLLSSAGPHDVATQGRSDPFTA